jgi:predicted GNAT family acetyltransferase
VASAVRDDREAGRYELDVDGQIVFANYRRDGSILIIRHVEAPPPLRGTGAAGRLMQGIVEIARADGLTVQPLCSYAAARLRRHPEHRDLLA